MRTYPLGKFLRLGAMISALLAWSSGSIGATTDAMDDLVRGAAEGVWKSRVIRSIVATGLNDSFEQVPFDLGEPFGTFSFAMLGVYNPSGPQPMPLTRDARNSDLLTTIAHPNFLALAGKTRADVQPGWENVPLREVPINVDFASIATNGNGIKRPLRGVLSAEPVEVAQAEPANPITVRQWKKGRGIIKIASGWEWLRTTPCSFR